MDLIKIDYSKNAVSARELYKFVFEGQDRKTAFNVWISRTIKRYGFKEGIDFQSFLIKSSGGRNPIDYAVTIDMAKELAMVAPTKNGRKARRYFIKCEEQYKKQKLSRLVSIELRKTLTDKIKESGENERMHGHAYSRYTLLAYNLCDIKYEKTDNFRDTLSKDQIERVKTVESMIKPLLEIGKEYKEIKNVLEPIFKDIKGLKAC
jgi:phage anti-repressor protein